MFKEKHNVTQELRTLKEENEKLILQRDEFKRQLDELKRLIFGTKSERFTAPLDSQQLSFFNELEQQKAAIKNQLVSYQRKIAEKEKEQPVRTAIPAHFPRVEETIEPTNIQPGAKKIGEEITELLEITPSTVFVRRIIRPKYALPNEQGVVIGALPSLPIPRGNAGASMLSFIAVSKFVDHLPLYRLRQIFKRQELEVSPSTISGWSSQTAQLLSPLYELFRKEFLQNADYLQADESPIKVQDRDKKNALHQGYMWAYRNPEKRMVLFEYNKGRGKTVPEAFFKNFTGTLQTDGYKVYQSLSTNGEITLLGCMAHARRYFEKAKDNDPTRSNHVLLLIQKLYELEREIKKKNFSPAIIKRCRMKFAQPILNELEHYLIEHQNKVLPKSAIGIAINYTLNIFKNLKHYLCDGKFEIDNNLIENAIRPIAIGRKNYLFAGSHQAAQEYAMYYSFFATCKTHNVNPFDWMNDVLRRIPDHKANKLRELLPSVWCPIKIEECTWPNAYT